MIIVISVSFIAILFTYLETTGNFKNGMFWGFGLLTILAAIHYDYGSDYMPYYYEYCSVVDSNLTWKQLLSGDYFMRETGWIILLKLFGYLSKTNGFFFFVAVLSILQNVIYYKFIKQYVAFKWWTFAVFLYLTSTKLYLLNFSMMRQGLVIAVFLSMWGLIREKKYIVPLIVFILMTFIHKSAIILIPFAFWGFIPTRISRVGVVVFVFLFLSLFFVKDLAENIFMQFMFSEDLQNYNEIYSNVQYERHYGMGFVLGLIPLILSLRYLWNYNQHNEKDVKLLSLAMIGSLISPFAQMIPLVARIGFYFSSYGIGSTVLAYSDLKQKSIRICLIGLLVILRIYAYFTFFNLPAYAPYYRVFHTVFNR